MKDLMSQPLLTRIIRINATETTPRRKKSNWPYTLLSLVLALMAWVAILFAFWVAMGWEKV